MTLGRGDIDVSLTRLVAGTVAAAMTLMGHAIRTTPTSLPSQWLWWVLFAGASAAAAVACIAPYRWPVAVAGAASVTAFVSRATAISVEAIGGRHMPISAMLTVPAWLLLGFLSAVVWWHLLRARPAGR